MITQSTLDGLLYGIIGDGRDAAKLDHKHEDQIHGIHEADQIHENQRLFNRVPRQSTAVNSTHCPQTRDVGVEPCYKYGIDNELLKDVVT